MGNRTFWNRVAFYRGSLLIALRCKFVSHEERHPPRCAVWATHVQLSTGA